MSHPWLLLRILVLLAVAAFHSAEIHSFKCNSGVLRVASRPRRLSASPIDDGSGSRDNDGDGTSFPPAAATMDDGGSDLTDRFKYKVHALMGTYDPPPGAVDDENQTGSIVGSLLQFPTEYTFTVVGNTSGRGDVYVADVKRAVAGVLGADAGTETRAVPRGERFTRVRVTATVESAAVIAAIYEGLDALDATVMKF